MYPGFSLCRALFCLSIWQFLLSCPLWRMGGHQRPAASPRLLSESWPLCFLFHPSPILWKGRKGESALETAACSPATKNLGPTEKLQQDLPTTHPSYPAFLSTQVCRDSGEWSGVAQTLHGRSWVLDRRSIGCVPRQSSTVGASKEIGHLATSRCPHISSWRANPCTK